MTEPGPDAVQRRSLLRPRPLGMGGALLAMVVATVIFIGLVIWYAVNPGEIEPVRLSELEQVHALSQDCHRRHPQLARTPQEYLAEALPALERARFDPAFEGYEQLEDVFCRCLALDADEPLAVLGWVEINALRALRQGSVDPEALDRAWGLLLAVHRLEPGTEGLENVGASLHQARERARNASTTHGSP